mgnify:CR=1 FL=1
MPIHALLPLLFLLSLVGAGAAYADPEITYNRVQLAESASAEVENDHLVVVMFAQSEGRDARQPADQVNQAIAWALATVERHAGIKAQTLAYQTSPVYKDGKVRGWRVRQSLRMEGTDNRLLGDLTGQLQERLAVQSVEYRPSEAQRRATVADLTDSALEHFTARAERITQTLGHRGYRLVRISIDDGESRPPPVMRAMVAEARTSAAPATFAGGSQRLSVSVSGEIELLD